MEPADVVGGAIVLLVLVVPFAVMCLLMIVALTLMMVGVIRDLLDEMGWWPWTRS